MRTTVNLDADVEAEVERLQRAEGLGLSEAVNQLARRGMLQSRARPTRRRRPRTFDIGVTVDVTNIGDVLDLLDETTP